MASSMGILREGVCGSSRRSDRVGDAERSRLGLGKRLGGRKGRLDAVAGVASGFGKRKGNGSDGSASLTSGKGDGVFEGTSVPKRPTVPGDRESSGLLGARADSLSCALRGDISLRATSNLGRGVVSDGATSALPFPLFFSGLMVGSGLSSKLLRGRLDLRTGVCGSSVGRENRLDDGIGESSSVGIRESATSASSSVVFGSSRRLASTSIGVTEGEGGSGIIVGSCGCDGSSTVKQNDDSLLGCSEKRLVGYTFASCIGESAP